MENIRIMGKKGSQAVRDIIEGTGIRQYLGKKIQAEALINYGLAGKHLDAYYRKYPSARRIPTVNTRVGYSKLTVVRRAEKNGIKIPVSKSILSKADNPKDFIEKRTNSIAGIGICQAKRRGAISGKYYQQFIHNRVFELRVHAFKWTTDWVVQKRVGPKDAIAWNFKQGGHFITVHNPSRYRTFVEARDVSNKILDMLGMSFGAVDFLVDTNYNVYFIEINSAPGYGDLSRPIYVDAFNALKNLKKAEVFKLK